MNDYPQDSPAVRNYNPLLIPNVYEFMHSIVSPTDPLILHFENWAYGWRAALVMIRNFLTGYQGRVRPVDTIEKIMDRFFDHSAESRDRSAREVAEMVGIDIRTKVRWEDRVLVCAIIKAMAYHQTKIVFPVDEILSVYDLIR